MESVRAANLHSISGAERDLVKRIGHTELSNLEDIALFKKNYPILREKMLSESLARVKSQVSDLETAVAHERIERELALKKRADELNRTLKRLESEQLQPPLRRPFLTRVVEQVRAWVRSWKIKRIKNDYQAILARSTRKQTKIIHRMEARIGRMKSSLQEVAERQIAGELRQVDKVNARLERERFLYYGALGERDVIRKLRDLPDTFHVINDYRREFGRPIYNRAEDDRIHSIQIDHIVVGPTGVFVIETKNWSDESLSRGEHFSPIKQVRRAGFSLFVLLNQAMKDGSIYRVSTGWGPRKISVKTAVAFRNKVPQGQYEYVKLLGIERLNSYIMYGSHEYNPEEIESIASYLISAGRNPMWELVRGFGFKVGRRG